jgi:hypothetical protein
MPRGIELLGRLPKPETVFCLGPRADEIRSFRDLDGKRVGIGAKGSGTASVARQVLTSHGFENLDLTLSQHSSKEQIAMLQRGDLDIAVFVMEKNSQMIEKAVRQQGMHIASFIQAPAMAARLPFVRSGVLPAGYYDPVEVVPAADRHLLEVDTLVAMNSCPSRSEMMAFLELLSEKYPDFIRHNIETPAHPAVSLAPAAKAFFDNRGPEFLDRHVPWLADIIPLSNLVTLAMVVSVLFNVMGAGHRFRLWRIDANRIAAEQRIEDLFGVGVTMSDISDLDPDAKYRETKNMAELDSIIKDLTNLARKVRDYSTSMLVPMGQEMAYRYQENTIRDIIVSLQDFREKLD